MKQLNLKQVLSFDHIKEGINTNIFKNNEELEKSLQKVISFEDDVNDIKVDTMLGEKEISFENTLYTKQVYLLESRAFDKETDKLIGTYLQMLEPNGDILGDIDNDVWGNDSWKVCEINNEKTEGGE